MKFTQRGGKMNTFIAVDIETTGLNPEIDQIIEIAAAKFSNGQLTETYSSLINNTSKLSKYIKQLTGITEEMLAQAPSPEQVQQDFDCFCRDVPLVFHNASFDLAFLEKFYGRPIVNPWLDTLEITRIFFPLLSNYDLKSLSDYFALPAPKHRALDDAITCGYLLFKNLEMIDSLQAHYLSITLSLLKQPANYLGQIVQQKYYQKAWSAKLDGQEFFFNSIIPEATEPGRAPFGSLPIDEFTMAKIEELVAKDSKIITKYPQFEFRSGQIEMLKSVCASFINKRVFIAEAATGTGKSLAYLIPAVLWSALKGEKVVISTHTINLQEQLSKKDLPVIKSTLGINSLLSTVIKGRNNYLCLHKLFLQFSNASQNTLKQNYFLARVINWLSMTKTGDKNELNIRQDEQEYWTNISSDSYSCLGNKCKFFASCFVMRAKKKADQANIIITNHSLLLSDIKTGNSVLPSYRYLIIDEAHNLEQESINHLTIECSSFMLYMLVKNAKQLLDNLNLKLIKIAKQELTATEKEYLSELNRIKAEADDNLNHLQQNIGDFKASLGNLKTTFEETNQSQALWLKENLTTKAEWEIVLVAAQNVIFRLQNLAEDFVKLMNIVDNFQDDFSALNISFLGQLCAEYATNLKSLLDLNDERKVVWLETPRADIFSLKQAPLEVGELLYNKIYKDKDSIVLTSATLTIEEDFSFFKKQVGLDLLDDGRIQEEVFPSPFDYEKQAVLCIPTDLPYPTETKRYEIALNKALEKLILANQGRSLVLFTSYQQLNSCYAALKDTFQEQNINLLAHHLDGSRTSIIEQFKKQEKAVIFGTNSFWEGIDIPGDSLTLLIIVKLPFQAPSIPTLAAKMEYLRKNGQDPFNNINLPQAIIRFKQGFGRLVRSQQDSGFVVVLDKRIIEKAYGKKFLNSLPVKTHFRGSLQEIVQMVVEKNQANIDSVG